MKKICPRCGEEFECLHNENMAACHCASVRLTAEQLALLRTLYPDCLCHACLVWFGSTAQPK